VHADWPLTPLAKFHGVPFFVVSGFLVARSASLVGIAPVRSDLMAVFASFGGAMISWRLVERPMVTLKAGTGVWSVTPG
jgi:peptidoglycan/LPS O-acetylase OafA/YrhL